VSEDDRVRYRELTADFTATVGESISLAPRLRLVRLTDVVGYVPSRGDTVALDVGGGELRRYTASRVDGSGFDLVSVLTGNGPATPYLDGLSSDTRLSGRAPERPVLPPRGVERLAVLGDATAFGTARSVADVMPTRVAIADEAEFAPALAAIGADSAEIVTDAPGWLESLVATDRADGLGVMIVGEQSANHAVRQRAYALGVPRERVVTRTFWRPDRAGIE